MRLRVRAPFLVILIAAAAVCVQAQAGPARALPFLTSTSGKCR
jgi:hypothetical protein